jgi:hypothetical protein
VLDGVCMVWAGCLNEFLEVVYRRLCLTLDTALSSRDVLHVGAILFFVVVVVIAGRGYDSLRTPLSPLLAILGILLDVLDDDDGWCRSAVAEDRFPVAWFKERPDCLLVGGVFGGDVKQLFGGVSDDVVQCSEASWEPRASSECLWPQALRTEVVYLPVTVSTMT